MWNMLIQRSKYGASIKFDDATQMATRFLISTGIDFIL